MASNRIQVGRSAVFLLAGMLFVVLTAMSASAQTPTAPPSTGPGLLNFTAITDNVGAGHDSIRIELLRWSTDAERDQMSAAWTKAGASGTGARGAGASSDDGGDAPRPAANATKLPPLTPEKALEIALSRAPTVGYLWSSEVSGYALHYAVRLPEQGGGERVILITDRRLGAWDDSWKVAGSDAASEPAANYEFSVIELHLNSKGEGEGKISLIGKIAFDSAAKTIALEKYSVLPVVLTNVKNAGRGSSEKLLSVASHPAASGSDLADAVMNGNKEAARSLLLKKVNVNAPQTDGSTALHWAVRADDLETVDLLLHAGANVSAKNHDGATPMLLAAINGNAAVIEKLIQAGADPNAPLTQFADTPLMVASRTGKTDAIKVLLDHGAQVNAKETWGGTTALMSAVFQRHADAAKMLVDHGADVNIRSMFIPANTSRGAVVSPPVSVKPNQTPEEFSTGLMSALLITAREGDLESARVLVAGGADVNAIDGDGKDPLGLAIYNGNYDLASFLVDSHAQVNHADAQGFTPLFWAVDRRNMETAPNFPWMVTTDAMPLIKKLLDAGANPNALINNTPRAHMREGSPRIVFATAIMRAAFSGDMEAFKLLLDHGADTNILSADNENTVEAAAGEGFINGYHRARPVAERLEVIKLLVQRGGVGGDVNWADNYGITPLMVAANMGEVSIIQYLVDVGADLGAHDLGKKYDGQFGASVEPLMPIDYAIGVGTFVPNNAAIMHDDAVKLMTKMMQDKGIKHTTSECSLRGFTCSIAKVDPKTATPAEIARMRKVQIGYQVDGITGGLANKDEDQAKDKDKDKK